jgi:hypothetical protein
MMRSFTICCLLGLLIIASSFGQIIVDDCDILIIGGTTAALGAALAAADNVKTCLTEPTNWVGGQLTSEGLPAIDFAWHKITNNSENITVNVASINLQLDNRNPLFTEILNDAREHYGSTNPGKCWVSVECVLPTDMLAAINKQITSRKNLTVYYNSVPKTVTLDEASGDIIEVEIIQRTANNINETFTFLSGEIEDWYTIANSTQYNKTLLQFTNFQYIIDASSFGDIMVLANASYLQGIAERYDGDVSGLGGSDTCGQAFTIDLAEELYGVPTNDVQVPFPPNAPIIDESVYSFQSDSWEQILTYRRVNSTPTDINWQPIVSAGDITVQNWGKGNDQRFSYILLSRNESAAQVNDWMGGVNVSSLIYGEALAIGWHHYFRANAPIEWGNALVWSPDTMDTTTGLAKMPYLRDTRRSIGIEDFVITVANISGEAKQVVGAIFPDRVGIGAYNVDVHGMVNCTYPGYMVNIEYTVLPFYIPFRALTNRDVPNLLVAGKLMAQSFLANSATRLHPEEFTSGQAAGAAAAFAVVNGLVNTTEIYNDIEEFQAVMKTITPLSWTINGTLYPNDTLENDKHMEDLEVHSIESLLKNISY